MVAARKLTPPAVVIVPPRPMVPIGIGRCDFRPNGAWSSAVPVGTCQTISRVFRSMAVSMPCGGWTQGAEIGLRNQSLWLL